MIKSLIPVLALVTGTFATAVSAQESTEANPPQPAAPTLDLGQPVTDSQSLGARYAKSTHGDWELACIRTENEDQDPCSLLQIMNGPQGNPMA
ncbi:MAG: invasion associated locus B family protein, partial [Pseudomonadota bacterium]